MWRARLRMWPTVSSAAEMMFEVGAFTTMTPAVGRRLDVDVVEADARAGDDLAAAARRRSPRRRPSSRSARGSRSPRRARRAAPSGRCRRRCGSRSRARGRRRWRARVLRRSARPALTRTIPSGAKRAQGALMCGGMRHTPWGRYPATLLEPACRIRSVTTPPSQGLRVRRSRSRRARRAPRDRG